MPYNWQLFDWPHFHYDLTQVESSLWTYTEKTARLHGMLLSIPDAMRDEAVVNLLTAEALTTSAIEGEYLDRQDVKSSIRNHLGLNVVPQPVHDLRARGLGEMIIVVRKTFAEPLRAEDLFHWHRLLLGYREDVTSIGAWRVHTEPMQIVSGPLGRQRVHFEAPPSAAVPELMHAFIDWFNRSAGSTKGDLRFPPLRAALAHLWFESVHPFEDGNGRIGRAVAEKVLSQGLGAPAPFSLSRAIEADKKAYYTALERAQRSNDITEWLEYFVPTVLNAIDKAEAEVLFIIHKARFFDRFRDQLNDRQLKVLRRMFEAGPEGFLGGMDARKYTGLTSVSKATATRDLQYLLEIGALRMVGGGRSTRYELVSESF